MKTFEHEWILEAFAEHRTFFTKKMFGGLAAYLVCTDNEHHASIQAEFPALMPHSALRKWLFIDSTHDDFESTMNAVAKHVASNDPRFGVLPRNPPRSRARVSW